MTNIIEKEIDAIKTLLTTLEPLSPEVRRNVLNYVTSRLEISVSVPGGAEVPTRSPVGVVEAAPRSPSSSGPIHLKDLVAAKKPSSANEMAALVAYYLENHAPPESRKSSINTKDIETYFKIAEFRLPKAPQYTLGNARAAGYFDAVGGGEYKLNAVGHNLVVHNLPHSGVSPSRPRKSKRKKAVKKAARSSRRSSKKKS